MATKIRGRQIETDDFIKSVRNSDLDWTNDVNTASQKAIAQYVASAAGGVLVCTFTLTSGITGTIDKTASEILQAANANKSVLCIYGNEIYFLVSKNVLTFSRIIGNACKYISYNQSDDNWMIITTNLQTSLVSGTSIKTINNESILGSGNIDTKEIVWCIYTETDSTNHTGTMSMSVSDIDAAIDAGAIVCTKRGVVVYYLVNKGTIAPSFCCIQGTTVYRIAYYSSDNLWHYYANNIQQALTSGTNIKTINNESLLGSGDISVGDNVLVCTYSNGSVDKTPQEIYEAYQAGKFVVCVASNIVYSIEEVFFQSSVYIIKFASIINSNGIPEIGYIMYNGSSWSTGLSVMQKQLVSGTNIKTINNQSLLGSGNITIQGGGGGDVNVIEVVKVNGTALTPDSDKAVNINDIPWSIVSSKPTIPDVSGKADKVIGASNGNLAGLNSSGNLTDSSIASSDVTDAVGKRHTHSNKTMLDNIPSSLGSSGQALCVNSAGTGLEFKTVSGGGGLADYDFTHTIASGVSGTVTVTFAASTRGSRMMTATADIGLAIVCNNSADNYIWVKNNGSSDIDVTINSVTYNNSSMSASKIFIPEDGITIPKGNVAEIGIVCNADGAFITARADLKANS